MSNAPLAIDFASHTNTGARALLATRNLGQALCTAIDKTMAFYGMHEEPGLIESFKQALFGTSPKTTYDVVQRAKHISMGIFLPDGDNLSFNIKYEKDPKEPRYAYELVFERDFDERGFNRSEALEEVAQNIKSMIGNRRIKANHVHGAAYSDVLRELIRDPRQNPADLFKGKPAAGHNPGMPK